MAFYRGWKGLAAKGVFQVRHPHLIGKLGPKRPTVISVWMTRVKSNRVWFHLDVISGRLRVGIAYIMPIRLQAWQVGTAARSDPLAYSYVRKESREIQTLQCNSLIWHTIVVRIAELRTENYAWALYNFYSATKSWLVHLVKLWPRQDKLSKSRRNRLQVGGSNQQVDSVKGERESDRGAHLRRANCPDKRRVCQAAKQEDLHLPGGF